MVLYKKQTERPLWSSNLTKSTLISDPHTKANLLNDYFCSVFTKEDDGPLLDNPYQRIVPEMEPVTVTEDGVINLLN